MPLHRSRLPRATALLSAFVLVATACSSSTASRDTAAPEVSQAPDATGTTDGGATASPTDDADTGTDGAVGPGETDDGGDTTGGTSDGGTSDGGAGTTDGGTDGGTATSGGTDGGADGTTTDSGATSGGDTDGDTGPDPSEPEADPLKIGYVYYSGNGFAAAGLEDPTPSSDRQDEWIRALEDYTNETGGFAGRPIEITIRHIDSTDTGKSTQQRLQTEACVELTEDVGVFMAIGLEGFHRATGCWINHETPVFSMTGMDAENDMLNMRPWILPNLWLSGPRMGRLIPHAQCERGWVNDSIGIVAYDDPQTKITIQEHMIPAFEACDGAVKEVAYISPSIDSISQEMSNAILRFRQAGVDRVALFVSGGGGLVVFANAAESQNYRPLIAVSSYDRPGVFAQTLPEEQRRNLSGAGFHVGIDVSGSAMPPMRKREKECFRILNERTNENFQDRGNPAVDAAPVLALATCDSFFAVDHALDPAAGQPLARRDVIDLLFQAGSSYPPVFYNKATWAPSRRDAVDAFAHLLWDEDGCSCMRYDSDFKPIPF